MVGEIERVNLRSYLVVVALALMIEARSQRRTDAGSPRCALRVYRMLAAIPLVLLVMFLVTKGVRWEVLLPGLAWRGAVLLYVAPAACELLRSTPGDEP